MFHTNKMIIDTSILSDFLAQNKDVLSYPVKSYPINEQNFAKWIENHSKPYRKAAIEFRRSTRHVSFSEFKETIGNIFADILKYIYTAKPNTIFLFVYPRVNKSNFFVALYLYSLLEAYEFKNIKIMTDVKTDFSIVQPNDLVILPDDASYSGQQFVQFFQDIPPQTRGACFVAIPYMSNKAHSKMKDLFSKKALTVIYSDKTQIFQPFLGNNLNVYTIYFDHKLADSLSIYHNTYAIGEDAYTIGDPDFIFEPMSLITGCEAITPEDVFDSTKECPPPFYKFYKYTYNGYDIHLIEQIVKMIGIPPPPLDNFLPPAYPSTSTPYFTSIKDLPPPPSYSYSLSPYSLESAPPTYSSSSSAPSYDYDLPPPPFYTGKRRSKRHSKKRSKRRSKKRSQSLVKRYFG